MDKAMTPSKQITDGQIEKAVSAYRDMLQKHRAELGSKEAQQVLGQPDYINELVRVLCRRVKAISNMIVRKVNVNRERTSQQVFSATGLKQYTDSDVVETMPRGKGKTAEVIFFQVGRKISDDDLEKKYRYHGLKSADPCSLAAVNEIDPAFADDHPNGTHWKDTENNWCYAAFLRWDDDECRVHVGRGGSDWAGRWWFAGVRK